MALVTVDPGGLETIRAHLQRIATVEQQAALVEPLLLRWETILAEDNKRGLLAGLDCNDQPMPPTQRERDTSLSRRLGGGKPLVPRDTRSRAIRLARTGHGRSASGYFAALAWDGFTASNGRSILTMHRSAHGAPYPVRDVISRPRPTAVNLARNSLREWGETILKYKYKG